MREVFEAVPYGELNLALHVVNVFQAIVLMTRR